MLSNVGRLIGQHSRLHSPSKYYGVLSTHDKARFLHSRTLNESLSSSASSSPSSSASPLYIHKASGLNLICRSPNSLVSRLSSCFHPHANLFDRSSKAFLATPPDLPAAAAEEIFPADLIEDEEEEEELEDLAALGLEVDAIKEAAKIVSGLPLSAVEDYDVEQEFLDRLIEEEYSKHPETFVEEEELESKNLTFAPDVELEVGSFFVVSEDDTEILFPNGLAGWMQDEYKRFRRSGFYLRPVVVELIARLQKEKEASFQSSTPLFIDGKPGVGKSAVLNQIVAWARKNDWIVLFFDSSARAIQAGLIAPSRAYAGLYDNIVYESDLLYGILIAHGDKLRKLPVKTPISVGTFEASENLPKTLFDLVKYGAQKLNYSGEVFHHFYRELCSVTEYPVLVAVDGIEYLTCDTLFSYPYSKKFKGEPLPAEKLSLSKELVRFNSQPLLNGTFIYSLTSSALKPRFRYDLIPKASRIVVPPFSKQDFLTLMDFYSKTGWIEDLKPQALEYVYSASGGLPIEAWKLTKVLQPGGPARMANIDEDSITDEALAELEEKHGITESLDDVPEDELDTLIGGHFDTEEVDEEGGEETQETE